MYQQTGMNNMYFNFYVNGDLVSLSLAILFFVFTLSLACFGSMHLIKDLFKKKKK